MKMMMQRLVVVVAVVSVMVACSSIAQAKPDFGADCSSCHGTPGGALDVLPSSLIEIQRGTMGQVTFDVTDVPSGDAAIALSDLDDANLMATVVGTGWTLSSQNQYASDPFFASTGPQVLDLEIDALAVPGDYGVGIQLAGGPGSNWASSYDFTLRVTAIPEPATLALLLTGLGTVGLLALRRRRKTA